MKWQTIPGWDRYEAREDGAVRSLDMAVGARGGKTAVRKGRLLSPARKTNGYWAVTLTNGRSRPQIGVHVIVARTFIGEQPIGLQVLHSDGNKDNNHYSNLRYGTQADNIRDAIERGRLDTSGLALPPLSGASGVRQQAAAGTAADSEAFDLEPAPSLMLKGLGMCRTFHFADVIPRPPHL